MFQGLLERILLKYFGEYLLDIDQNGISLAIWNGSLKIEGLKLNPSLFSNSNLPIKLKYGWIGRLEMFVPWSKLSVLPVEIKIKDVFIILSPLEKKLWGSRFDKCEQKFKIIEETLKKILGSNKPTTTQTNKNSLLSEYFGLFLAKIIDNIQLSFENLHIRFENDKKDDPFAFGLTLKYVCAETKDPSWTKKIFYDRTNPKNKAKPINKQVILKDFGVYLMSNPKKFFGISDDYGYITQKMNIFSETDKIHKKKESLGYILDICFDLKITMNFDNNYFTIPEYFIHLNVEFLAIDIKHSQIQQIIRILEFFNEFDFFISSIRRDYHYVLSEKPLLPKRDSLNKKKRSQLLRNLWNHCVEVVIFELRKSNFIRSLTKYLQADGKKIDLHISRTKNDMNLQKLYNICKKTSIDYLKIWFFILNLIFFKNNTQDPGYSRPFQGGIPKLLE